MTQKVRPGYYEDAEGNWQPDRRSGKDRRTANWWEDTDDRRKHVRRKIDRDLIEREHKLQIQEALEDFAEEHEGRL
ncbi:MAG: hypothetical protein ACLFTT_04995 [Candidatus Hydrogenedentota bacterium]